MVELLKQHEFMITSIRLIPSDGGRFEVAADETMVYSKLQTKRHPEDGEVSRLMEAHLKTLN